MKTHQIEQVRVCDIRLGDLVLRSDGQVTNVKALPVEQITKNITGRVELFFGRIPVKMMADDVVWVVKPSK
jgi:hypothetical protein